MRILELESTDRFVDIGGNVYCRVWVGRDDKGQRVMLVVHHLQFEKGADLDAARKELRDVPMTGLEQTTVCTKEDVDGSSPALRKGRACTKRARKIER